MKRIISLIIVLIGALIGLHETKQQKPETSTTTPLTYPVLHIIDGDTIVVKTPTGEDKVRLIGIDAPETNATNGAVECFGLEATEFLRYELEKETVTLELDSTQDERDTYGRLLAYVFLNGTNVNQLLLEGGYAREFTFNKAYHYRDSFKQSEVTAKEAKKGMWSSSCDS
jgi:micrococcal nuclease